MKKDEIHLWDIKRILFGQAPPEFLVEVFIRSLIIYIAAIFVMRFLGKRMNGQLTIVEKSIMVMMGAILAVPMQIPDRGIAQGFVALLCTLACLRLINLQAFKSSKFEKFVQGSMVTLVTDGVLNLREMNKIKITKQQVYEVLRSKKIFQLGKVKRLYLEACGEFSVYPEKDEKPGLPIFPPDDPEMNKEAKKAEVVVCNSCGKIQKEKREGIFCANCGNNEMVAAIYQ